MMLAIFPREEARGWRRAVRKPTTRQRQQKLEQFDAVFFNECIHK
jgi:hypothetical protein